MGERRRAGRAKAAAQATGRGLSVPPRARSEQFSFQLVDAYLYDCRVVRRESQPADRERPHFDLSLSTEDEAGGFLASLSIKATFRFRPEATAEIDLTTFGVFRGGAEIEPAEAQRFREADCAVILWPYARAHLGLIASALDLDLPPLPTIDARFALEAWGRLGSEEESEGE